jgi:hypothetical protein
MSVIPLCIQLFSKQDINQGGIRSLSERRRTSICDYAYHHWGSHARRCYEEDGMPKAVSEFLLETFDLFE